LHGAGGGDPPEPLQQTLERLVDFDRLREDPATDRADADRWRSGVVANPAHGNGSVVFHDGGIPRHGDAVRQTYM